MQGNGDEAIISPQKLNYNKKTLKEFRKLCVGSFDLFHYGHADLLRRVAKPGNVMLIIGLHSDFDMKLHEGVPVFTEDERIVMLKGNKWVDEVILNTPYVCNDDTLEHFSCDSVAQAKHHRTCRRTRQNTLQSNRSEQLPKLAGISESEILNRILTIHDRKHNSISVPGISCNQIIQFSNPRKPMPNDVIIYAAGAFDLLHPGHIQFLEAARKLGDYLIVGVHADNTVTKYHGENYPIMTSEERALALSSCKHVSEVIFDAPHEVTEKLLKEFSIHFVVCGKISYQENVTAGVDPYKVPKRNGIFKEIDSGSDLTTHGLVERVTSNWHSYQKRLQISSTNSYMDQPLTSLDHDLS